MRSERPPRVPRAASLLDHALRLLADVRPGEGATVALMTTAITLLMLSYYVLKTAREPLILGAPGGAELKSYAAALQALTLMALLPAYNRLMLAARTPHLLLLVVGFFLVCIQVFFVALRASVPIGVLFFVWVGVFSLSSIALFWSFANEVYTRDAGERLFPVIGVGMTGGAFGGSLLAGHLFGDEVRPAMVLQAAAALLLAQGLVYALLLRRCDVRAALAVEQSRAMDADSSPSSAAFAGFRLIFERPYLRLIALLVLLLNLVNTTGEYILSRYVLQMADVALAAAGDVADTDAWRGAFIGEFYGEFFFWVNVASVTLQAFVASRLVKYLGVAGVLFALPVVAAGAYLLASFGVAFSIFRWAKTWENATDYSVMNTTRAMLWLPTTRREKYLGKQSIDTLVVRLGDLVSAALVFAGTTWLGLDVRGFAMLNVVLVGAWVAIAWLLYRSYRQLAAEGRTSEERAA